MSVQYQKEIFSNGKLKLFINFSGIDQHDTTTKENLFLTIYAVDASSYSHVFSERLNYSEIKKLYDQLNNISIIRDDQSKNSCGFVELTPEIEDVLTAINKVDGKLVKSILDKANEDEKLRLVLEALNESEIQNLHAAIRQTTHQKALEDLKHLLILEETTNIVDSIREEPGLGQYLAGQPEKIFQNWIEKNIWTLGIDYIKKHPSREIGIESESDLIMETTDGFIDLIELKRPKFKIFSFDESHKSSYPSKELAKVLGQCMKYLKVLEDYKLILEKRNKFKLLRPRIKIIVGRSYNFSDEEHEALRMLNASLNQIQVISYDYLEVCGNNILSYYNRQLENAANGTAVSILPAMS
jgi:hypothetical protein